MSSFLQKYNQTKRMKIFCFIIGLFLSSFFCFSQTNVIQSMDTNFVLIIIADRITKKNSNKKGVFYGGMSSKTAFIKLFES